MILKNTSFNQEFVNGDFTYKLTCDFDTDGSIIESLFYENIEDGDYSDEKCMSLFAEDICALSEMFSQLAKIIKSNDLVKNNLIDV